MIPRSRILIAVALFTAVLAAMGYELRARHLAAAAAQAIHAPQLKQADLRQVMQTKMHQEYTYLSFTIWHDQPLTDEKLDSIAASSARVINVAKTLDMYETVYRQQGWSSEDVKFFSEKRVQLSRVAEELNRAAKNHDSSQVVSFFMHMDNTCQSCHKRFRPDLSWT